jgi:glycine dehydrogenase
MSLNINYREQFVNRHNSITPEEELEMLKIIGVSSVDELISKTIPASIRLKGELKIADALTEQEFLKHMRSLASKNKVYRTFIGQGYYNNFTPNVVLRNILENPGWYTQYTPYQAEIAQGRLEALLNFQTMVMDLTGMEVANASLLDEATAAGESIHMFHNMKGKDQGDKFFVSSSVYPQTLDVLMTRAEPIGVELVIGEPDTIELDHTYFGALLQYPNNEGNIQNYTSFVEKAHQNKILVAFAADLLTLTMLTPPGELGADVVLGNTQRLGVPMGYGGPHAAFFATKDEFKRNIPGRLIGVSIDANGNHALRMALQTREQHIRRDKATSNICTAQVLLAIMSSMYAVYHGPKGLRGIAERTHGLTRLLDLALSSLGYEQNNAQYFDTLNIAADYSVIKAIKEEALKNEVNFRYLNNSIGISLDETSTLADVQTIADIFAKANNKSTISVAELSGILKLNWEETLIRKSSYLTHPVFNSYHTEHEMLRYIKRLEGKDLSMVHSMISLGSCTMKLNATAEMIPVTWPEMNQIHPFAPTDQAMGYAQMIHELSHDLIEITGFAGMSLQPNSGAQGEYAGLMVVREYFKHRGESNRNIALIPSSAHGTNPASAVMAGMKVVVVACDEEGYIKFDDLKAKAEQHKDNLAILMVTYPSTHGVYEEDIIEITDLIHACGGQVYMDGANMNAQVGLTSPGNIGADVCHLNLHKTFCIPHGGGGPGMGPIGVAKHLIPYLPGHKEVKTGGSKAMTAVSAAPFGSASILVISYAYIKMMGAVGLRRATETAILNANYMRARFKGAYDTLYSGKNGTVAHEMILDTRPLKITSGVQVEDIAKRLMDYGFHAPTVSFPVAGTLMIEPTESESKAELDRFCDAMISIRREIAEIEKGIWDQEDNPLKNAPHTAESVMADDWKHAYSRSIAAYPLPYVRERKFWPSVARVDNTYGDRNLVCSCLPMEAYAESN